MKNFSGRLERSQFVPRPRSEVFAFFSDAMNLEAITPANVHFQVLTPPPIVLRSGTLIDYRLRLFGVWCYWQTLIEEFQPQSHFVDSQRRGPYRRWHHRHEFEEVPGGTLVRDLVDYEIGFGPLGRLAHALFVRRSLEQIFDYRARRIGELFGIAGQPAAESAVSR